MDLHSLKPTTEAVKVDLMHPVTKQVLRDESGEPIWVAVYGIDSERHRAARRTVQDRRLNGEKLNAIGLEEEELDLLVADTERFSPNFIYEGQPVQSTPQEIRRMYKMLPWLRRQVDEAIAEQHRFINPSANGSWPTSRDKDA